MDHLSRLGEQVFVRTKSDVVAFFTVLDTWATKIGTRLVDEILLPDSTMNAAAEEISLPVAERPGPSRRSSSEEALPSTYEQSTIVEVIPGATATPKQVRDFLKHLLITKRTLTVGHAE